MLLFDIQDNEYGLLVKTIKKITYIRPAGVFKIITKHSAERFLCICGEKIYLKDQT